MLHVILCRFGGSLPGRTLEYCNNASLTPARATVWF